MWAENCRSSLQLISATPIFPLHDLRSTPAPADFFITTHHSAPTHRIFSPLCSTYCHTPLISATIMPWLCLIAVICFPWFFILQRYCFRHCYLYNSNTCSLRNVVINRDRKYSFIRNVEDWQIVYNWCRMNFIFLLCHVYLFLALFARLPVLTCPSNTDGV